MNQWLDNYGYLLVILAAVCVVFVIILYFAAKAYRKRTALYKAEEAEIKRLVALKEKFRPVTKDAIENASADELLEGIALSYQLTLQKEEDIEGRFNLFNDDDLAKKCDFVYQTTEEMLSDKDFYDKIIKKTT